MNGYCGPSRMSYFCPRSRGPRVPLPATLVRGVQDVQVVIGFNGFGSDIPKHSRQSNIPDIPDKRSWWQFRPDGAERTPCLATHRTIASSHPRPAPECSQRGASAFTRVR
jgi:hypothetical protein